MDAVHGIGEEVVRGHGAPQPQDPIDVDVELPRDVGPGEFDEIGDVQDGEVLVDVAGIGIPGEEQRGGVDRGDGGLHDGRGGLEVVLREILDGGIGGDVGPYGQAPRLPEAVVAIVRVPADGRDQKTLFSVNGSRVEPSRLSLENVCFVFVFVFGMNK